jgi:hypothetical protein
MCRQAKQAGTQITLDEDLNVPDSNPDVELIIQSRERVNLEHTRAENGKLYVDGCMAVSILYMDDTAERNLHRLEAKLPFEEAISMEGLQAGETVSVHHETEDLNVTMINSRKLAIRGIVSVQASVDEIYDMTAAVETQTSLTTCERSKKLELMQLAVQNKDIFRLKEEVQLPSNKPNIQEILWDHTQLRGCHIQPGDGALQLQGKLILFVLYRGGDESQSLQWMEQAIPFEGKLDCSGCQEELVPDIEVLLSQVEVTAREDTDGELRLLHLEGVLELDIRIYGTDEAEILEDVYSPQKELILSRSEEIYESLVMKNASRCKVSGRIRIQSAKPRILQICHASGGIKIDNTVVTGEGLKIEGAIPVSILYISSDDTIPFAVLEGTIPFTHLAEVPDLDENCRFQLRAGMDQLLTTMADSEEIEVKVTAALDLFVARPHRQQCIQGIEEKDYEMAALEAVPGITGYIVGEGESLWDIAKQYYLTPQQIMTMNELESETIQKGDCLILMKTIPASATVR